MAFHFTQSPDFQECHEILGKKKCLEYMENSCHIWGISQPSKSSSTCERDAAFPWIKCNTKSKHRRKGSSGAVDTYGMDKLFPEGTELWGTHLHCCSSLGNTERRNHDTTQRLFPRAHPGYCCCVSHLKSARGVSF